MYQASNAVIGSDPKACDFQVYMCIAGGPALLLSFPLYQL